MEYLRTITICGVVIASISYVMNIYNDNKLSHGEVQMEQNIGFDLDLMIEAIRIKEGYNGKDGPYGEVGPLQILQPALTDYNRANGTCFVLGDMRNIHASWLVCQWYLTHYGINRGVPEYDLPRIWNGGPDGHTESNTKSYGTCVYNLYRDLRKGRIKPHWEEI